MPISDQCDYISGHFDRVYNHVIKPAVIESNFIPIRADEVASTDYIIVDIIKKIINTPLCICDLSSKNPNVYFELGFRQAFDLPVVLIKDLRTDRVFDIQGLRTIEYDDSLRVDSVDSFKEKLVAAIKETWELRDKNINSLIRLVEISKAEVKAGGKVSSDTAVILNAIKDQSFRLEFLEKTFLNSRARYNYNTCTHDVNTESLDTMISARISESLIINLKEKVKNRSLSDFMHDIIMFWIDKVGDTDKYLVEDVFDNSSSNVIFSFKTSSELAKTIKNKSKKMRIHISKLIKLIIIKELS